MAATRSKSKMQIRRIAISTGGGDAPGLNAVIKAAVYSAINRGWECLGIRDGFNGIFLEEQYPEGGVFPLTKDVVRNITHLGGTILGTTNRGNPMKYPTKDENGNIYEKDRTDEIIAGFKKNEIDAVISIGGDGSLTLANHLAKKGMWMIGVPKTIDNDLDKTVITFGFDTAVSFATECIDRLHSTAESHRRIMVVEVMGRYAGWIAVESGIASSADVVLIPEIPYHIETVAAKIKQKQSEGKRYGIVVVAEGAKPYGGTYSVVGKEAGRAEKLGGAGEMVAKQLQELTGRETRTVVLGHLLRGGSPTTFDRCISLRFGAAAVRAIEQGKRGVMVALDPPLVRYVPFTQVTNRMKTVPLDSDMILTCRDLGICLGD